MLEWHRLLLQLRDHYADPAVNPRERFSVGVAQDAHGTPSGVAITSARQPLVDDLTVRQTGAIAYALSGLVNERIESRQRRHCPQHVQAAGNHPLRKTHQQRWRSRDGDQEPFVALSSGVCPSLDAAADPHCHRHCARSQKQLAVCSCGGSSGNCGTGCGVGVVGCGGMAVAFLGVVSSGSMKCPSESAIRRVAAAVAFRAGVAVADELRGECRGEYVLINGTLDSATPLDGHDPPQVADRHHLVRGPIRDRDTSRDHGTVWWVGRRGEPEFGQARRSVWLRSFCWSRSECSEVTRFPSPTLPIPAGLLRERMTPGHTALTLTVRPGGC